MMTMIQCRWWWMMDDDGYMHCKAVCPKSQYKSDTHTINTFNGDIQIPRKVPFSLPPFSLLIPFLILSTLLTEIMKHQDRTLGPGPRKKTKSSISMYTLSDFVYNWSWGWGKRWMGKPILDYHYYLLCVAMRQGTVDVYWMNWMSIE